MKLAEQDLLGGRDLKLAPPMLPKSGEPLQAQPGLQLVQPQTEQISSYKVLVRFTSVTIHNTHEGTFLISSIT